MAARLTARAPDFPLESLTTRPLLWILAGIAAFIAVSLALASLVDIGPIAFFSENGPVENLQAGFYGVAAICFGWAAWSSGERLHRRVFAGLGLFVAALMLREFDFTHSDTPTLALLFNSRGTIAVMLVAWLAFAALSWRDPLGLLSSGLRWVFGRGGRPLIAAAVLLLLGSLFDHHYLPVGRTIDLIGEEALELVAAVLVLLSAAAALLVSRSPLPATPA
jgi:hypothetical protein